MLSCDHCSTGWHIGCITPPFVNVPIGCEPCEKFDNYHITNGFFQANDHKYAINIYIDKQSPSNGR